MVSIVSLSTPRFHLFPLLRRTIFICFGVVSVLGSTAQLAPGSELRPSPNWPPRIIYNTDGNWAFNYLQRRNVGDLTVIMDAFQGTNVDVVSVLVGIDDDLSWRGIHGQLWGDNVENWDPDVDPSRPSVGGMNMAAVERLHRNLAAIVEDGHDLLKRCTQRAHQLELGIYASFRMNDAHASNDRRGWYGRSKMKLSRPDLLIGSPAPLHAAGGADQWNFACSGTMLNLKSDSVS